MATGGNGTYDYHRGKAPLLRPTAWWRAGAFMAVNLIGFAVVCAFWEYLTTGQWMHFSLAAYARDLKTPVGEVFIQPLGVLRYPWMIMVTGLLLGVTVFVPIIVAVLYRLHFAGLFVFLVAAVAHVPAVALVTALGCLLAARTQLRSDMPFAAVLLGMLPVAGYLYVLGFMGVDTVAVMPLQRWVLYAPFVTAIVAAVLAAAAVLAMARVTNFRPGAVWPVLLLMLVGPLATFYVRVGADELAYSLLARRLAAGDSIFESRALAEWTVDAGARGLDGRTLRNRVLDDLQTQSNELAKDCRSFLARYPRSRRAPEISWIQAHCISLQVDQRAYKAGMVRYTSWYCRPAAKDLWNRLVDDYGGTTQATLGRWRLGEMAICGGDLTAENELLLRTAVGSLVEIVAAREKQRTGKVGGIFLPPITIPTDGYYENALFAAQRLLWLMEENDVLDDAASGKALVAYLNENPNRLNYHDALDRLAAKHAKTSFADNLKLAAARANPDRAAAAKTLLDLAAARPATDATVEANYLLGQLALRPQIRRHVRRMKQSQTYFQVVVDAAVSPWRRLAIKSLAALPPQDTAKP